MRPNLNRVILSLPSLVSLAATKADTADAPRSWIQLAKTGTFHSTRYGQFSITRGDLAQMLHNFNNVTPAAPTELPIDYDHLSMDPKQPGDGKAAGWLKRVELRAEGDELWGEVEFTPEAADLIKNRAYRFVSPFKTTIGEGDNQFVRLATLKDHTHKDGRKIGTTLLAAAITNHPFLEGMQALTLYSFSAMGDLALVDPPTGTAVHLAELGQHVTFLPDAERTPELTDEERRQTLVISTGASSDGSGRRRNSRRPQQRRTPPCRTRRRPTRISRRRRRHSKHASSSCRKAATRWPQSTSRWHRMPKEPKHTGWQASEPNRWRRRPRQRRSTSRSARARRLTHSRCATPMSTA